MTNGEVRHERRARRQDSPRRGPFCRIGSTPGGGVPAILLIPAPKVTP